MKIIREPDQAYDILKKENLISLDIETDGLKPKRSDVYVISMAGERDRTPVVLQPKLNAKGLEVVKELARDSDKTWLTHNGTGFDLLFLRHLGIRFPRQYDTLIGEQVLSVQGRHDISKSLSATMKRRIGKSHKTEIDHSTWRVANLSEEQLEYVANDVIWLHDIKTVQERLARERGLHVALAKEQALSTIIVEISNNGMAVDLNVLHEVREEMLDAVAAAADRLKSKFGPTFNVMSPKQVKEGLHSVGIPVADTSKGTLLALPNPEVKDVLAVRKARKRNSLISATWEEEHVTDGRVSCRYWQVGTESVRFSCSDPNMQQIPREMRKIFGNEDGKKVVQADWAQLEIRIAAHYTKDDTLLDAVLAGDVHDEAARILYHLDSPNSVERRDAKGFVFTWLYAGWIQGIMASATLAGRVVATEDAENYLRYMAQRFPKVGVFHNRAQALIAQRRQVVPIHLPWGHQRQLLRRAQSPQKLVNTLIQGTAAVGMKESLFEADKRGLIKYMGGVIHDEFVCTSVPANEAEELGKGLTEAMIVGMEKVCDTVPIAVDVDIVDAWKP